MKNFTFNSQTAMFFGHNCIKQNAEFFKQYGSKAVVFTSAFPEGHKNLGLEDVREVLGDQGIECLVIDAVYTDPPVEVIAELTEATREFNADFFVAVGGGSSIDTAKAVAVMIEHAENSDPYELFWGSGRLSKAIKTEVQLPIFAVPTTAGTGAEVTPYAVLTRGDINTKRTMYHNAFPTAAFLDSRYIKGSPKFLLHAGIFDALAHGIESYLHTESTPMGRMLAEYGFGLFRSFKDNMTKDQLTDEDFDSMQLAAFVQGMAVMQSSTTIPHGLGYPLSQQKRVSHGLAGGIFLGKYLLSFKDQSVVQQIIAMCGFECCEQFDEFCRTVLRDDIKLELTEADIQSWTDNFMETQTVRLNTNPEPLSRDDIESLYRRSLACYIVG